VRKEKLLTNNEWDFKRGRGRGRGREEGGRLLTSGTTPDAYLSLIAVKKTVICGAGQ